MRKFIFILVCVGFTNAFAQKPFPQIVPVNFSKVKIADGFWQPRINQVTDVTIPVCIDQTEVKTPRIKTSRKLPARKAKTRRNFYDDSDVQSAGGNRLFVKQQTNQTLEQKADEWIDKIAAAQLPDGYIGTLVHAWRLR